MRPKYTLKRQRFILPAGTVVYAYTGHDYGCVGDDNRATGTLHMAVTLDPNGGPPFFTVPLRDLEYEMLDPPAEQPQTEPPAPAQPPRRLTFDEFRAALQRTEQREQWQPIETAPKDGKVILLGYHNSHGNWRTMRGCWLSKEYIDEYWEDPEGVDAGWFEVPVEADEPPNCWPTDPTHWMPLPAAPGITKKEGT